MPLPKDLRDKLNQGTGATEQVETPAPSYSAPATTDNYASLGLRKPPQAATTIKPAAAPSYTSPAAPSYTAPAAPSYSAPQTTSPNQKSYADSPNADSAKDFKWYRSDGMPSLGQVYAGLYDTAQKDPAAA